MPGFRLAGLAVTLSTAVLDVEVTPLEGSTDNQSSPPYVLAEARNGTGAVVLANTRIGCVGGGAAPASPTKNRPCGDGSGSGSVSALSTSRTAVMYCGLPSACAAVTRIRP